MTSASDFGSATGVERSAPQASTTKTPYTRRRPCARSGPTPVPADVLARIHDAAVGAPSGGNNQRRRFLLLDKQANPAATLAPIYQPVVEGGGGEVESCDGRCRSPRALRNSGVGVSSPGADRLAAATGVVSALRSNGRLADATCLLVRSATPNQGSSSMDNRSSAVSRLGPDRVPTPVRDLRRESDTGGASFRGDPRFLLGGFPDQRLDCSRRSSPLLPVRGGRLPMTVRGWANSGKGRDHARAREKRGRPVPCGCSTPWLWVWSPWPLWSAPVPAGWALLARGTAEASAPNLLTGDQASFAGTTGGWSGSNAMLTPGAESSSLRVTGTALSWAAAWTRCHLGPPPPPHPGDEYTGDATVEENFLSPAAVGDALVFFNSAGTILNAVWGRPSLAASTWSTLPEVVAMAPASTAYVALVVISYSASQDRVSRSNLPC